MVTVGILSGIAEGEAGGVALKLESSGKPKAAKAREQNRVLHKAARPTGFQGCQRAYRKAQVSRGRLD